MTPEEYTAKLKRNMDANPNVPEEEVREALAEAGVHDPTLPVDLNETIKRTVTGATGKVNEVLGAARRGTANMMPANLNPVVKELANPVPGNVGEAAALFIGVPAGAALTKGAAGLGPSLVRGLAPAAAGAAGDALSGDPNLVANALLRGTVGLGAESVGGAISLYKRLRGLTAATDTARTAGRLAETGNDVTKGVRPLTGEVDDLVRAGEHKPAVGSPKDSASLEAALDQKFKRTVESAGKIVGQAVNVRLPDGRLASFREALDEYAGAAAGKVDAQGNRIDAQRIWERITRSLFESGDPKLERLGWTLENARGEHAQGMSVYRLIAGLKDKGIVKPDGTIDMPKLQARFHEIATGKKKGLIDPEVRDSLERSVKRGANTPESDVEGQFKLGWIRFGGPHMVGGGMHPDDFMRVRLPRQVGTGPSGLAPETEPVQGIPRALLSILGQLAGQNVKESGKDRE